MIKSDIHPLIEDQDTIVQNDHIQPSALTPIPEISKFSDLVSTTQGKAVRLVEQLYFMNVAYQMNTSGIPEEQQHFHEGYVEQLNSEIQRLKNEIDSLIDLEELKDICDFFPGSPSPLDSLQ